MLKMISKTIRNFYIEIDGCRTKFRTKETAIKIGKLSLRTSKNVKLIEENVIWMGATKSKLEMQPIQEFDRTNLLIL